MGDEQTSFQWEPERRLYSVSELNAAVHALLDREFQDIWVAGEISGVKLAASGHYYFTLKDQTAQLRCVCFGRRPATCASSRRMESRHWRAGAWMCMKRAESTSCSWRHWSRGVTERSNSLSSN